MKKIQLLASMWCISSMMTFGQTNVISLKSCAGDLTQLPEQTDNFGIHPGMELMGVDSIRYCSKEKIVVQYKKPYKPYNSQEEILPTDTFNYKMESDEKILEHLRAIRLNSWYPAKTVFIDFPKAIEMEAQKSKDFILNTFPFWMLLGALGLGWKFRSTIKHKQ